jgi:predicted dehydrogenase/nucleoside-diphosphate-sugar epimerase
MTSKQHRVGVVGAGLISEFHVAALRRIPNVEILGLYDIDPGRAQKMATRLGTKAAPSIEAFAEAGADVLHIVTPPETHAALTLRALELGCHVMVEKPLATDVDDCRRIEREAAARGLQVCVDHSLLYDIQVRRAIEAVRAGEIGKVVSVDILRSSVYPPYEGGALPPQYRTGGYPFRDLGIHALYVIQEFLGPIEDVRAAWTSLGGDPNLAYDEWRAIVRCRDGLGQFQLSWNVKPLQNLIIVQGTKGVLRADVMLMFQSRRESMKLPKAAERVANAYSDSLQPMVEVPQSVAGFLTKRIRQFHGVQELITDFYRRLDEGLPVPVSVADAIPVIDWVERVARKADAQHTTEMTEAPPLAESVPILITGAAGALGTALVSRLLARGEKLRLFVRRRPDHVPEGVEIATGDLGNPEAVDRAVKGAKAVIHAGAATTKGGRIEHRASTVIGTENVVNAALKYGVEQLVYISSMSVVDWAGADENAPITESSSFEPKAESRGAYTQSKRDAELIVRAAVREKGLPAVILRPGQIFGGKLPLLGAAVARRLAGRYVVLGDGELRLPLVHMEDVVDGVIAALDRKLVGGEVIQLVDTDLPTQNEILARAAAPGAKVVRVPRRVVFALGKFSEIAIKPLKRQSPLNVYRLRSALARRTYASESAEQLIGWKPNVGVSRGIAEMHQNGEAPKA